MKKRFQLGVIGGGFMAHAIVEGAIGNGFLHAEGIAVSEPNASRAEDLREKGVYVCADNRLVAENCDYLLFAVKPQIFSAVAEGLEQANLPVVITIMAGKTKESVRTALGGKIRIARAMPNLPCSVGEGIAGIDTSELSEGEREFCFGLFASTGSAVETDESLLNAVTALSGSGPAYVYLFLQSLIAAGREQGLSEDQARELAFQTVKGGVRMAELQPEKDLQKLIDAVSSKGGTTVAALESFARDDFKGSVSRAVGAAARRAEELSR